MEVFTLGWLYWVQARRKATEDWNELEALDKDWDDDDCDDDDDDDDDWDEDDYDWDDDDNDDDF